MNNKKYQAQHLAILVQPFLDLILQRKKTIETRFTKVMCPPFQKVRKGDIILLKKSGGLVLGEMTAGEVEYFANITTDKMEELKKYSLQICADYEPNFWDKRKDARYVSFIHIESIKKYDKPYPYPKKDRRAWLVLDNKNDNCQLTLFDSMIKKE